MHAIMSLDFEGLVMMVMYLLEQVGEQRSEQVWLAYRYAWPPSSSLTPLSLPFRASLPSLSLTSLSPSSRPRALANLLSYFLFRTHDREREKKLTD